MEIQIKTYIAAKPETVYQAVTTKQGYQGWWTRTCDIDSEISCESSIRFEKENFTEEMIFKAEENLINHKFLWICTANNVFPSWVNTTLIFEIKKHNKGSMLYFSQTSLDDEWLEHNDYLPTLSGWKFFMSSLKFTVRQGMATLGNEF